MVEEEIILTQGGVYLARLNPAKAAEIGKIRPVVLLNTQAILDIIPLIVFVCPLSSHSQPQFHNLHLKLFPRDNLQVVSYALVEHCRSITVKRLIHPRLAQLATSEVLLILHYLKNLVGL